MTSKAKIAKNLRKAKEQHGTWWGVSNALYDGKVSAIVLSRIANPSDNYFPKDKDILDIIDPRRKPADDEIAKRTLVIHATLPELHAIQKRLKPRERTERLKENKWLEQ